MKYILIFTQICLICLLAVVSGIFNYSFENEIDFNGKDISSFVEGFMFASIFVDSVLCIVNLVVLIKIWF